MTTDAPDLYAAPRVQALFGEMSRTYGFVNLVSSLGFAARWRRQCVERGRIEPGDRVCDLMAGMGECLPLILRRSASREVVAVDFCREMCDRARGTARRHGLPPEETVREENVLQLSLADGTVDCVVCAFGLKTTSPADLRTLAEQVRRVLRPGGRFSFVEISEPRFFLLRWLYLPYIRLFVPLLGALFLGNPDNYRQLGVYTKRFGDCSKAREVFAAVGFDVRMETLFFGCASVLSGTRPV